MALGGLTPQQSLQRLLIAELPGEKTHLDDPAIVRLVSSQLLEQLEEWQLERRRFIYEATMSKIPEPKGALEPTDGDTSTQPAVSTSRKAPAPSSIYTEYLDH